MADVSQDVSPSLFDAPPSAAYLHAKEFVRWCCGFGSEFRNSPDITNLRYWAGRQKLKLNSGEEAEILDAARGLFLKRVEQAVRKAERAEKAQTAPN